MASFDFLGDIGGTQLKTVEMHTAGEPTRIVFSGFPSLNSDTLLKQRAEARSQHDHIRRALICEPRGHREMYGAILRHRTELVDRGEADIGVLFLTNEGFSTMCGHATLAVSRLIVDSTGRPDDAAKLSVESIRRRLVRTAADNPNELEVRLHVPCGLVKVIVPISMLSTDVTTWRCDTSRPISYFSVPSFASGIDIKVPILPPLRWPELGRAEEVIVDVSFGGTFYLLASPAALGFAVDALATPDLAALGFATKQLKAAFNASEELRRIHLSHPDSTDLQFLYSTILVDRHLGEAEPGTSGAETGICFFADGQVDRSPTGSGVQARVALAHAKGQRRLGESWTYHSLVSNAHRGEGAFVGGVFEEVMVAGRESVVVKVSGHAHYTGSSTFVIEDGDEIGKGFWFGEARK